MNEWKPNGQLDTGSVGVVSYEIQGRLMYTLFMLCFILKWTKRVSVLTSHSYWIKQFFIELRRGFLNGNSGNKSIQTSNSKCRERLSYVCIVSQPTAKQNACALGASNNKWFKMRIMSLGVKVEQNTAHNTMRWIPHRHCQIGETTERITTTATTFRYCWFAQRKSVKKWMAVEK